MPSNTSVVPSKVWVPPRIAARMLSTSCEENATASMKK